MPLGMRAILLVLAGAGLLTACAATKPLVYGPIGEKHDYGYKDWENADGGHTVAVVMPPAGMAEIRAWFDRRAQELCPGGVERTNIFSAKRNESSTAIYGPQPSAATRLFLGGELQGYVYCKPAAAAVAG